MEKENMLVLSHVSKAFGSHKVIHDLSFSVPEHTVFGFIGQNGAGKTTTMKMILGLLQPDHGEIFVHQKRVIFGQNKTNKYIGYLPDVPQFYGFMTPMEYLILCGQAAGMLRQDYMPRASKLLELVGLAGANKRIHGFSRGMKQRLGIAQALLNRPRLLICDEPTSALDPVGRKEVLTILSSIKKETTIIFSTHILSDVERICDEVACLHQGEIALCGTMEEIKAAHKGTELEIEFDTPEGVSLFAETYPGGKKTGRLRLRYEKMTEEDMAGFMMFLAQNRIAVKRIERLEPTLETLFMGVAEK